jgi:hypothetical protein
MIYRVLGSAVVDGSKWPSQSSILGDRKISYTLGIEKCFAGCFEQHCDRRATSGDHAEWCNDAYRLPVPDGPAGTRIKQMTVPAAVDLEKTFVIAAGRKRAARELDRRDDFARPPWVTDSDAPRSAILLRPGGANIAAKVDKNMLKAVLEAKGRHPIRRVFLADAAEVHFHSSAWQTDRMLAPFDIAPADRRYGGLQLGASG